jgi:sulfite exporter TauE/SafE
VARGGAADGALALAAFGAGTVPSLFGIAVANHLLVRRPLWNRGAQAFALLMGVWFLWQGLSA